MFYQNPSCTAAASSSSNGRSVIASHQGGGRMLQVTASPEQTLGLNSSPFNVSAGQTFNFTVTARIEPGSEGSGFFILSFPNGGGEIIAIPSS